MASKKLKASEKSAIVSKLVTRLKKRYGSKAPSPDRSVLETYIYAACLEDATDEQAEAAYATLLDEFHDLNEIRVSLISEIERTLETLSEPAYRARRIREGLYYVFEHEENFAFDLESLKKKTQDSASGELAGIPHCSPFMRLYTLNQGLGAHVFPLDTNQLALLKWIGLVEQETKIEDAADEMKSAVRKADVPLTAFLLRQASSEPKVLEQTLDQTNDEADDIAVDKRAAMVDDLIDGKSKPKTKKPVKAAPAKAAKKTAKKKAPAKKAAPAAKAAPKTAAKAKKATKKAAKKTAKK